MSETGVAGEETGVPAFLLQRQFLPRKMRSESTQASGTSPEMLGEARAGCTIHYYSLLVKEQKRISSRCARTISDRCRG